MNSENLNEIASALVKAQAKFMGAAKDAKNPFFKSTYATLNAVWEAVAPALTEAGLTVIQPIVYIDGSAFVRTTVIHTSGQFITSECPIVCARQNDPQALGSAITYARRYSLASMLGVMTCEDDDAEKAMNRPKKESEPDHISKFNKTMAKLEKIADASIDMGSKEAESQIGFVSNLLIELKEAGLEDNAKQLEKLFNSKLKKPERK